MLSYIFMAVLSLHLLPTAEDGKGSDAWITMKARLSILTTEGVKNSKIHIDTQYGVVTLYGRVDSAKAKTAAERTVAGLDGVIRVDNMLQVVSPAEHKVVEAKDSEIDNAAKKALEAQRGTADVRVLSVDKGVVVLGGDVDDLAMHVRVIDVIDRLPGVRRVESKVHVKNDAPVTPYYYATRGQDASGSPTLADAWITSQVKLRLIGNELVPANDVHVDTWDGVVTLWGRVDTERAKLEAAKEAQRVENVVRVHNDLIVDPRLQRPKVSDQDIESDVKRLLAKDSLDAVGVAVKNGIVRLTGKVDTQSERVRAAMVSRSAKGARAVKNELEVQKRELDLAR